MEDTILFMIFAGAFLLFMIFKARNYRHKNYTRLALAVVIQLADLIQQAIK